MKLRRDLIEALGEVAKVVVPFSVSLLICTAVLVVVVFAFCMRAAFVWP